jgi:hypothetical protein
LIRDTLNSSSLILVRNRKRKRISGYYRRRIAQTFDEEKVHQRNKVETVFSVMKRRFGESLKARKYRLRVKEIKIKVILYNLLRMILTISLLIFIEGFYRANIRLLYKKSITPIFRDFSVLRKYPEGYCYSCNYSINQKCTSSVAVFDINCRLTFEGYCISAGKVILSIPSKISPLFRENCLDFTSVELT